jgi:hypothetical protein
VTAVLAPLALQQFVDNNNVLLTGGKLFTYAAGTTTKLATYTDATGSTPNTNPVVLNSVGEAGIWLTPGVAYKFTLSPATDSDPPTNAFWTVDQISAPVSVAFTGDSGAGGAVGLVPAPAAGNGAAGYVLLASGAWGPLAYVSQSAGTILANLTGGAAAPTANSLATFAAAIAGTTTGTLAAGNDSRFGSTGQSAHGGSYTLALTDAGVTQSFTATATLTIPANATVAFPLETAIPVRVATGATLTISIASDTLTWIPSGSTGSRTLTGPAYAVLTKATTTGWTIGAGGIT